MSRLAKGVLRIAIMLSVVLIAVQYVDFSVVWRVSFSDVFVVMLVVLVANIARCYTFKMAIFTHGIHLMVRQWLGLGVYSSLLNLFLPLRAGLSVKAIYLKRKYNFRYAEFLGVQGAISLLQVYVLVAAGGFCGVVSGQVDTNFLGLLLVFLILAVAAPFVFKRMDVVRESPFLRALYDVYNSFLHLVKDWRLVVGVVINMAVILFFTGLALYFSFSGLGMTIGLAEAMLIGVVASLLNVISITPGNFGIQELVVAFLGQAVGGDFDSGFVAMLLVRAASIISWVLLSPVAVGVGRQAKGIGQQSIN